MTDEVEHTVTVAGRAGLVARGMVYALIAVLAVQVAMGGRDQSLDKDGALRAVARQRFGWVVLLLLTVGFAGYATWRLAEAVLSDHELRKRALHAGRGLLYVPLTISTARLLATRQGSGSSNDQAKTWSARVMAQTGGRTAVIAIGLGAIVGGGILCWRGARKKFEKHLRLGEMPGWQRRWLPWLGTVGNAARGVVLALIGLFLIRAAVRFDPNEAVGVDGALQQVAQRSYGPFALGVVALGLLAYGLFSLVEARYRDVLE